MVLYEALSGKRWPTGQAPEAGDWSRIPAAARPGLRKALAIDPERRWADAQTFRNALRVKGPAVRIPRKAAILAAVGLAAIAWWALSGPDSTGPSGAADTTGLLDLAVFPCVAEDPADSVEAENLGWLVALDLEDVPGIQTVRARTAWNLYDRRGGTLEPSDWTDGLGARHALRCRVDVREDSLHADLRLLGETGNVVHTGSLTAGTLRQAAVDMSLDIANELNPRVTLTAEEVDRVSGHPPEAVLPFLFGEDALRRGAWRSAERHYEQSLEKDSTLTLARWRLAEAQRWQADRPIHDDLNAIRDMDLSTLSPLDSLLLEAGARPHGPEQLEAYEAILGIPQYSRDPYATLLYADELYHRGPLWGVAIDSAVSLFRLAVERDSSLVPAVEHLTQALIRTDQASEALRALEHLREIHASKEEADVYYPDVWGQAFLEKFDPGRAAAGRDSLVRGDLRLFAMFARFIRYIDAPSAQAEYGRLLVEAADRLGDARSAAQGFVDRGLGLIGTGEPGRIEAGVAAFDSAARRYESARTRVQAAEWAVVPYALGVGGFGAVRAATGETVLEDVWQNEDLDPCLRVRAAIALALLADRRGDAASREAWASRLESMAGESGSGAERPERVARGLVMAWEGNPREALRLTGPDVAYDSIGLAERPFLRSIVYLKRGEWYRESGMADSARASWIWHQNTDLEGVVEQQLVQAGEVDGALGPHAEALIADLVGEAEEP
jgi:tetratricopeptide (TPR) repeat protein